MLREKLVRIVSLIMISVLLLCSVPLSAGAAGTGQVVVVGACTDFGISKIGDEYTGFAYDYLSELQRFTGHRYSFVEADRDELLQMLAEGKIDMLPCVSEDEFLQWQARYFGEAQAASAVVPALSEVSLMKKFTAVYVCDSNPDAPSYFDTEALNRATIGYLSEDKSMYFPDGKFVRGDIDNANFVEYSTETQMQEDFYSGRLDAVIKECYRTWANESIVYQYGTRDCFFLTSGANSLLAGQLDIAVNSVYMANSSLAFNLYYKHMAKYGAPKYSFSAAEKAFIEANPEITVAYNLGSGMMDTYENGELNGITGSIMDVIEHFSGLKINIRACSSLEECVELLEGGEVTAICGGVNRDSMEAFGKFTVSFPYSTVPIVISGKAEQTYSAYKKIAVPYSGDDIYNHMKQIYPEATLVPCTNIKACMDAVRSGTADVVCAAENETLYMINNGFDDMAIIDVSSMYHGECFAYPENYSVELYGIFGKCISQLLAYSDAVITYSNSAAAGGVSFSSGASANTVYVVITVVILIILCVALFLAVLFVRNKHTSETDPLTGGRNKGKFFDDTRKLLKRIPADKLTMVLFDINKFKYVNDRLGYEEGDRMLVRLHKTIADDLDDDELFSRLSDDNFACVIRNGTDNELTARLNGIFSEFDRRNSLFVKYPVVFSAGVCRLGECCDDGTNIDLNTALDRCKIAKRTLKSLHYSSIAFYDGKIRDKALREKDYETLMPSALVQHEFECYLQPKYGLKSRHIEGAEALIRWNSKEFGFIFPNEFIPISEKNGFVVELDFFILEEVCRAMRRWLDEGRTPVVISVNQSRLHLNYDDYIWRLREIVDKYEIPYGYIELELTESVFMENAEKLLAIMQKLHDIGFKLSLDDFGSGYSSLNMLKDIPVDVVKIDREFFTGTVNSEKGRAVISTVVDLAKNLNMEVISEGVETLEQVEFLTEINCAMVQGYYFAKPMNMTAFEELWFKDLEMEESERSAGLTEGI